MRSRRLWASTAVLGLVAALLPAGVAVAAPSCTTDCYVSPSGDDVLNSGTSFGDALKTIQAGVNAVSASGTVHVAAGTYVEDVTVNTSGVHLVGDGIDSSIISGPIGGGSATVRVNAAAVVIEDFTITREGNTLADWNNIGLNLAGIAVQSQGNSATIRHNKIIHNRTGVDINHSNGNAIVANLIVENRTGVYFRNQTDDTTLTQNKITDNTTLGVLFLDASGGSNSPVQQAHHSDFSLNNISGNWYGQIVDRQGGGSLPAPGTTNLKDFSANWLGSTDPVITSADSTEPGYAAQVPSWGGGTATAPGGQPDVAGPASGNFDITPLLHSGSDTDPGTIGFQGSTAELHVVDDLAQVGSTGRVREGINRVDVAGTVDVAAGTYVEDVTVNKTVALRGAQAGNAVGGRTFGDPSESVLDGQLTISEQDVRLNGFSITHDIAGDTVFGVVVENGGSAAVIRNNIFHKIKAAGSGGSGAQAIYLNGGPDDVQIEDNLINKVSSERSAKGILIGDSDDLDPSVGVLIQGNIIKDVNSTLKGAYGISAGNKTGSVDLQVLGNEISDLSSSSGWVHAIGLERTTPHALVRRNVISNLSAPGPDKVAVYFEDNPSYNQAVVTLNSLDVGAAAGIAVQPSLVGAWDLDGTCNWWGAASGPGGVGPGSGSGVTPGVKILPWLKSDDLSGVCDGGWPKAKLTPTGHDFGSQTRGTTSAPFTFTLENVGQADLPVWNVGIVGVNPNSFAIDTDGCGSTTLAPGAGCDIKVVFQPNAVGGRTARLEVATGDPLNWLVTADLSGEGTAPLPEAAELTPGSHDFGNRDTGTASDAFVFTLTNTGGSLLTSISVEIVGPDALQFTLSSGGTCTSTLPAGTSCSINVRHVPTAAGSHAATLRVTSSDPGGPDTSGLTGSATTPGTGTITILQDTVPNSRQDFSFRDGLGDFVLDDDDTGTLPRGRTFTGLTPGSYTVEQIQVPGWSLTAVTCDNGARTDLWWHTAGIDLEAGKHVRCTFTNTRRKADGLISVTSKKRGFAGNNIYRSTVVPAQTRAITAGTAARTYTFWVKAQNDSRASDRLRIAASSVLTGGATVTFRVGNGDRTAAISGGTFVTNPRKPGAHSLVQVRVTIPAGTTPAGATVTFTISSDSQPTVIDVVQGTVAR